MDDPREIDGNFWLNLQKENQILFMCGFLMGVSLSLLRKPEVDISDLIKSEKNQKHFSSNDLSKLFKSVMLRKYFDHLNDISLDNIILKQLIDGLNTFYEKFDRRNIKIIDAIYVVKMQIEGKDPELIDAQILYLKRQPISEKMLHSAENKTEYFKEKYKINPQYNDIKYTLNTLGIFIDSSNERHSLFCYGKYK